MDHVSTALDVLADQPSKLREVVDAATHVDRPIRSGAWTVRQVVFHMADSHTLASIRTHVALCGESTDIAALDGLVSARLYACMAAMPDVHLGAVDDAVAAFALAQQRWLRLLHSLDSVHVFRTWTTPQYAGSRSIARLVLAYAWHGNHHIAQIEQYSASQE